MPALTLMPSGGRLNRRGCAPARAPASVVGLVWRSVILWMGLLALLTLANLVG